jgi:hypothetical protein
LDFPADVITDLQTKGDQLSVYAVTDAISAERIAIAVMAGKKNEEDTAYAVFDQAVLEELEISVERSDGGTYDAAVNKVHYDLNVGTARKLLELAGVIAGGDLFPILKKEAKNLLRKGFESGQLDHTKNPTLCAKVGAHIEDPRREETPVDDG